MKAKNVFHCPGIEALRDLAAIRVGDTPVPIPNTTVKTHAADGTSLETVRESRWPPESKEKECSGSGVGAAYAP